VAYLLRGITRITMRVMMLKKKPRMQGSGKVVFQ